MALAISLSEGPLRRRLLLFVKSFIEWESIDRARLTIVAVIVDMREEAEEEKWGIETV